MDAGELLQYGKTADVFHRPASLRVARAFSDPPINLLPVEVTPAGNAVTLNDTLGMPLAVTLQPGKRATLGLRANALRLQARPGDIELPGSVELAEIAGSDTYLHVRTPVGNVVAQLTGVHFLELGAPIRLYLHPDQVYVFDESGLLLMSPKVSSHPMTGVA